MGIDQYGDPVSSSPSTSEKPVVHLGLWLLDKLLAATAFVLAVTALLSAVLANFDYSISKNILSMNIGGAEEFLLDTFGLPALCFGTAILIAYHSRSMIEKVNPRDAAWFPAKPLPDTPINAPN